MFSWHAIPFARILLPFITGIFIALYLPFGFAIPLAVLVLIFGSLYVLHNRKNAAFSFRTTSVFGLLLTIGIIFLGYSRTFWFNETRQQAYFEKVDKPRYLSVTIDDAIVEKQKFYKCYAKVESVIDSADKQHTVQGTILLYLRKGPWLEKPQIGDRFMVKADYAAIQAPANPGEFNYQRYLSYHNINSQLFGDSISVVKMTGYKPSLYRNAAILKDKALTVLQTYITSKKELGVAEALLLGYKDDLDPDVVLAFSRTGTLHVLAVSGLHAALIFVILAFISGPLLKFKNGKVIQAIVVLSGIWLYAYVTGLSSSVLRASIMFSFITVGKLLKHHVNIYNNIYSSAFLLLLFNPLYIVDVGFQLSYLAVLGIVFIQPLINKWYTPRYTIDKYIWGLISVSFAAQLLTFPIGIFYFHQFPNYFLLSNLIIIPLTSVILFGLIALLVFSAIPAFAVIIGKALYGLVWLNNWLVEGIDRLPYSFMEGLNFDLFQMVVMYLIFIFFLSFCIHRKGYLLNMMLTCLVVFGIYGIQRDFTHNRQRIFTVHHIKGHDVFTCIEGRQATIIADSGFLANSSSIKFFLEPFFWEHGIREIEKHNLTQSFVKTNIYYEKNRWIQFFDKILTIDDGAKKYGFRADILYVKKIKYDNLVFLTQFGGRIKIAPSLSVRVKEKFIRNYFEQFKKPLNNNDNFIQILF
ncbi:MAG: ComEC/Rec2 family competence protein [Bacteroidota bacterium]